MGTNFKSGYIKVSETDELYYEAIGNKKGFPILFIHGGPGYGFDDEIKNIFDFNENYVICFEQRRCIRSKFYGKDILENNTTKFLIDDILKVINYFGFSKVNIVGHSWGTVLSLIFAIKYPEKIKNVILSGVFLPISKFENDFLFGNGNEKYFPDYWEDFISNFPKDIQKSRKKILDFISKEIKKENYKYLLEWYNFEDSISFDLGLKQKKELNFCKKNINSALIEFHFIMNGYFIPENFILDNIKKLNKINFSIIHGRYDSICPCSDAWLLNKKLKKSKIKFIMSGHSLKNKNMILELKKEVKSFLK